MKLNAAYEIRDGYLYVKMTGEYDPTTAQAIFFEWIEKAHSHALKRILCDITLITGFDGHQTLTMAQFNISEFMGKSLPKDFRLAFLETKQQLIKGRFLEDALVNRGVLAKVTYSMDKALEWLGVPHPTKRVQATSNSLKVAFSSLNPPESPHNLTS